MCTQNNTQYNYISSSKLKLSCHRGKSIKTLYRNSSESNFLNISLVSEKEVFGTEIFYVKIRLIAHIYMKFSGNTLYGFTNYSATKSGYPILHTS